MSRRNRRQWFHRALRSQPTVRVKRLRPEVDLPKYHSAGAAGFDLQAFSDEDRAWEGSVYLRPNNPRIFWTGLAVEIPEGFYGVLLPRSSTINRYGLLVVTGTIDSDYRGQVAMMVVNIREEGCWLPLGSRIAQLVIQRCERPTIEEVSVLSSTHRGGKGFGSTG